VLTAPSNINFVIDHMAQMSASKDRRFLAGAVNADETAVIGYSMGGYGALIAAGAGVYQYS
jgi:predicted dienelactone hydrolase